MLRWSRNSCFLDSLLVLLLRKPSRYIKQHILEKEKTPLVEALNDMARHIQAGEGVRTSDEVRKCLPSGNGYESFDDGRPHECSEVLQCLLTHFGCLDTLKTVTITSVQGQKGGCWLQRRAPVERREAPVWVVPADQLIRVQRESGAGVAVPLERLCALLDHQDLDEPLVLTDEDRAEMDAFSAAGAGLLSYTAKRSIRSIAELHGDVLFVDLRRTFLHSGTMQELRTSTPVMPPRVWKVGGRTLRLEGMVLHTMMHYVTIVRQDGEGENWVLMDDRAPGLGQVSKWEKLESDRLLQGHIVMLCYLDWDD